MSKNEFYKYTDMNKPILTRDTRFALEKYLLQLLLIVGFAVNVSNAQQPCGSPSPLTGVTSVVCNSEVDTFRFRVGTYNAAYTYQLSIAPIGGYTSATFDPAIPGFIVVWGNVPGNYNLYFQVINPPGNACADTFNIHLSDRAAPQMNCNDTVNVSLDEFCSALIYPSMFLEGPFDSMDYSITIVDAVTRVPLNSSPYVNGSNIGKYYIVYVTHICSGNYCWGYILVEDKIKPKLACSTYTINCDALYAPENIGFPVPPGGTNPLAIGIRTYYTTNSAYDNCGPVTLRYTDRLVHANCPPPVPYIDTVFRDWTATDSYGNITNCSDTILIRIGDIGAVICPPNYDNIQHAALSCSDPYLRDAKGNPHPDETGYPSFVHCRNLDFTYNDIKLKVCEGSYKILREWIIADWCTGRTTTCIQVIKVLDDRLILTCSLNQTIVTLPNSCEGETTIAVPQAFKECSHITWNVLIKRGVLDPNIPPSALDASSDGIIKLNDSLYKVKNIPVGLSWVLFIGTDNCGNIDTCATEVTVIEKTKPIAVCDLETVVALTDDGSAKVYAETFDDGSHDNCAMGGFRVRRMTPGNCPSPIKADDQYGPYVEFCCNDIPNNPTLVVLEVSDLAGNTNECMVRVIVQDKKPPVVTCLPNITISCEFDYSNLGVFGTYRRDAADRRSIKLFDPTYDKFVQPHLWGYDGLVIEDCNLHIDSSVSYALNHCGIGNILRRYTFYDDFNAPYTCDQYITVVDSTPFNGAISWPASPIEVDGCHAAIDPNVTGKPSWPTNLTCSNILATYDDQVFSIVENVCFKVLRKWTVVDWCIYDSKTGYGRWSFTQVIKVKNSIAPTFTSSCSDVSFEGISSDCNGFATLVATAIDDCQPAQLVYNYEIDLGNNGSIDYTGIGNNASGTYPVGTHRIKWTVTDQCGNATSCTYLFTILDKKKPSPVCVTGIVTVIMPSNGQITIWASDFNSKSFDNCTPPQRLNYSFSSDPSDRSRTYTCSQIDNGVSQSFDVRIYVWDENNNFDYCDTKVIIQDGLGNACPDHLTGGGSTGNLAGNIYNEANSKVENAMVTLNANMPSMPKYEMTRPDGQYSFIQIPLNENYILSAEKTDDPLNGVTTQDIVLIQRHILGLQLLNSPYKLIAADVNNSQSITAKDVSDLRRLILGVTTDFIDHKSWKFVNASQVFTDINHPWPFNENSTINQFGSDKLDNNFIAVKMGDVSGNARTSQLGAIQSRTAGVMEIAVPDVNFSVNELVRVPVRINAARTIYGMQSEFNFDPSSLSFVDIESGAVKLDASNFISNGFANGKMRMSWEHVSGVDASETLFTLVFRANRKGDLSRSLTLMNNNFKAEAYGENTEAFDLALKFYDNNNVSINGFYLFQNQPNPFSQSTNISFQLPKDGEVRLKVTDVDGRVLMNLSQFYKSGFHTVEIDKRELNRAGVLYYQLEMEGHRAIRKMLLIE